MKSYILTSLLLIFSVSIICAQEQVVIEQYENWEELGTVHQIHVDGQNNKWLATDNGVFKMAKFELAPEAINQDSRALAFADTKGALWAGFDNNYLRNLNNGDFIKIPGKKISIRDMVFFGKKMWVATDNGILVFDTKKLKLTKHHKVSNSDLKTNDIRFIHVDIHDIIWIGTDAGIHKYEDEKWKKHFEKDQMFKVIDENEDGRWSISDKGMFIIYDEGGKGNRVYDIGLREDIFEGNINDMVLDNNGKMYIASQKLARVDTYNDIIENYGADVGLLSSKCLSLACDKYNRIFIGTQDGGLFRLRFADNEANLLSATCSLEKSVSCYGEKDGALKITATGGTPPYSYKWDKSRIKGRNPRSVAAGTYYVTVSDRDKVEFVIDVTVPEPKPITMSVLSMDRVTGPGRRDGTAKIIADGGTGTYNYKWRGGNQTDTGINLGAGKHNVTITDGNGCKEIVTVNIEKEKFIPDLDIAKVEVGQTLRINDLFFRADSSDISQASYEVLDEIHDFLVENPSVAIEIGGHTNNIPSHEYCDRLSGERAANCAEYLYEKGIATSRIAHKGYGKRKPISKNNSLSGRKKNQRVEIKILSVI